jgi:hypothetical protein
MNLAGLNCLLDCPSTCTNDFANATKKEIIIADQKNGRTLGKSPKLDANTALGINSIEAPTHFFKFIRID